MDRRQQWRAFAILPLVISLLLGSVFVYVAAAKSVVLVVDGQPKRIATMTTTVAQLLAHAGVDVSDRDEISPSLDSKLRDRDVVIVKIARPVYVDIDGRASEHYVTALDVDTALTAIGISEDSWVDVARSTPIAVEGITLKVREPKRVVISVDGQRQTFVSTAPFVRTILRDANISLGKLDRVNVPTSDPLHKGMLIRITRVAQERITKTEPIKFESKRIYDKTLLEYKRITKSAGRNGLQRSTYLVTYENGKVVERKRLSRVVVTPPKNAVVVIGTKKRSVEQLNWTRLANCESHGRPTAVSRGGLYYGLFQFTLTAWKSVGGTGKPSDASAQEQLMRAKLLYTKRGAGPWPHCGRLLFTD